MDIEPISVLSRAMVPRSSFPPSMDGGAEAFSFVGPSAPRDFEVIRHTLLGVSPLSSYSHFIRSGVQSLIHQINSYCDRGLIASPVGGRDIFESFLRFLHAEKESDIPFSPLRPGRGIKRKVLIITRGKDNFARWQKRLDELFQSSSHKDRFLWNSKHLEVRVESIDTLCHLKEKKIQDLLSDYGFVTLDQEHHIRGVQDDLQGPERGRYIHVLKSLGFIEGADQDFRLRARPGKFLLGLSESLRDGAGCLYGANTGLVLASTLTDLRLRGIVRKPEVREIVPEGNFAEGVSFLVDRWTSLSRGERLKQYVKVFEKVSQEYEKLPRTMIYASSHEEALELKQALESKYSNEVALLTSDFENREEDKELFFNQRGKKIAISVLSALEGVDEYRRDPVDVVMYAGVDYAGGETYALQAFCGHLGGDGKVPLMIDVCGMFELHPMLVGFDPHYYAMSEGKLVKGAPLKPLRVRQEMTVRSGTVSSLREFVRDVFDENAGKATGEFLRSREIHRAAVAMKMDVSESRIRDIVEGGMLPGTWDWMRRFGVACGLDERELNDLKITWSIDRSRGMEERYAKSLSEVIEYEREALSLALFGLYFYFEGQLDFVTGVGRETLLNYFQKGEMPTKTQREKFIRMVVGEQLWGGSERAESLMEILFKLPSYWKLKKIKNFSQVMLEDLESWLRAVRIESNNEGVQKFALIGRCIKNEVGEEEIIGFRAVSVDNPSIGKFSADFYIIIEFSDNCYHVRQAGGGGASEFLDSLRDNSLAGDTIWVPTNADLKIKEMGNDKPRDFLKTVDISALQGCLVRVKREARASGKSVDDVEKMNQFVLLGVLRKNKTGEDVLGGFRAVAAEPAVLETFGHSYFQITIELKEDVYHVRQIGGNGYTEVLDYLRSNPLAGEKILVPTNLDLEIRGGETLPQDFLRTVGESILQGYLNRVRFEWRAAGKSPEEAKNINCFSLVGILMKTKSGHEGIVGFQVVPWDPKVSRQISAGYFQIVLELEGVWHVRQAKGGEVSEILDSFRNNPLAGEKILVPSDTDLKILEMGISKPLSFLETMDAASIKACLEQVRLEARASGIMKYEVERIWKFALVGRLIKNKSEDVMMGFRAVSADSETLKKLSHHFKIIISCFEGCYTFQLSQEGKLRAAIGKNPLFLKT